jgi:uncharacterized membrane protein YozB (DUF420 family)
MTNARLISFKNQEIKVATSSGSVVAMPSTPNLIIQAVITVLLTIGVFHVKRRKLISHGYATLAAVILNALSVIIVMLPSVLRILTGASLNSFTLIVIIHSILGAAAVIVGVYLMATWRLRTPGASCFRLRNYMRPLAIIWILSAALGAYVYYMLL